MELSMADEMSRSWLRVSLDLVATAAIIITCGALLYLAFIRRPPEPDASVIQLRADKVSIPNAHRLGNADAEVVLLVYSDFSCSGCGQSRCLLNSGLRVAWNKGHASHKAAGRSAMRRLCARWRFKPSSWKSNAMLLPKGWGPAGDETTAPGQLAIYERRKP